MRFIVILKTNKYYVCAEYRTSIGGYEIFDLPAGGELRLPFENIEAIERYSDSNIEELRFRLNQLRKSEKYEDGTLLD